MFIPSQESPGNSIYKDNNKERTLGKPYPMKIKKSWNTRSLETIGRREGDKDNKGRKEQEKTKTPPMDRVIQKQGETIKHDEVRHQRNTSPRSKRINCYNWYVAWIFITVNIIVIAMQKMATIQNSNYRISSVFILFLLFDRRKRANTRIGFNESRF